MPELKEMIQSADWQKEKHVPVIECADAVKAGEFFDVKVTVGQGVAHPNTTEHHIRFIALYYVPEGGKIPMQIGHFEFSAHGESTAGANEGSVYTNHAAVASMKIGKAGTLLALGYCNIHGLWQSSKEIKVK